MPPALLDALLLAIGIALLVGGGDLLVRGASTIAARLGVQPVIVGLTIVAFGTSAPELALNLIAASNNNTALSFGNVIGSNIANVGLILGLAALVRPMRVHAGLIARELPIMLGVTVVAMLLVAFPPGVPAIVTPEDMGPGPGFARLDGAILGGLFILFVVVMIRSARKSAVGAALAKEAEEFAQRERLPSLPLAIGLFLLGLALLLGGGQLAERGAVGLATALGLSQEMIGLTVVAVATSLPELATSLIAARKGQTDLAVGNVVGSNIFNLLLILGATAMYTPVPLPPGGWASLAVMLLTSVLLLPFAFTANRHVSRLEGLTLLVIYFGYMGYEVVRATT